MSFHHSLLVEPVQEKSLCTVKLNEQDVETFRDAIEDLYYFEFVLGMFAHNHRAASFWHANFYLSITLIAFVCDVQ